MSLNSHGGATGQMVLIRQLAFGFCCCRLRGAFEITCSPCGPKTAEGHRCPPPETIWTCWVTECWLDRNGAKSFWCKILVVCSPQVIHLTIPNLKLMVRFVCSTTCSHVQTYRRTLGQDLQRPSLSASEVREHRNLVLHLTLPVNHQDEKQNLWMFLGFTLSPHHPAMFFTLPSLSISSSTSLPSTFWDDHSSQHDSTNIHISFFSTSQWSRRWRIWRRGCTYRFCQWQFH